MEINFTELINCKTAEEVQEAVRQWSSEKSDQEHLIRSSILDMHASTEKSLKDILFWHMLDILFEDGSKEDEIRKGKLETTINRMNFLSVYRLLKPCLDAFPAEALKCIREINNVRNLVVHGSIDKVLYKGKNPFKDHEVLAQIFVESWAAKKELQHFYERMIEK